ncbi:hypothetical protein [Natronococcus wangiae]|uniref:hypothetical protein n=1 Tax=Natronococcus wangiae TaxID=3068275 RepID=UPI00273F70EB|nr:hypothetical protein [Natronococcus sp. AD5]
MAVTGTSLENIPSNVDVGPQLGEHVETTTGTGVSSDRAMTDGGVTSQQADNAEHLEGDESDPWEGPFPEFDKYGMPTGTEYVRCRECGREVLSNRTEFVTHRESCQFGEQ